MHSQPDRSLLIRFLASAAALAAFALTTSCGSAGSGTTAQPPPPPPCAPSGAATARFTNLHENSVVTFSQTVSGTVKGIPSRQDAWLVVWPLLAPAYWPQRGALAPDTTGRFTGIAGFGASATTNQGEKFNLMLVEACPAASQRFQAFNSTAQHSGMSRLPSDARIVAQITVRRV
jgi:hypothetical protein